MEAERRKSRCPYRDNAPWGARATYLRCRGWALERVNARHQKVWRHRHLGVQKIDTRGPPEVQRHKHLWLN
ncbi:hypothetical protein V6N13_063567 [Hibiscus sabdariffa]|uniref:Uncharacterized protein n=1 Tax=Hibiscus sabdariffa TaxID=183260 RepID=A0ABR2NRA8_9ROSI